MENTIEIVVLLGITRLRRGPKKQTLREKVAPAVEEPERGSERRDDGVVAREQRQEARAAADAARGVPQAA